MIRQEHGLVMLCLLALAVLAVGLASADMIVDNFTGLGSPVAYGIDWQYTFSFGQGWAQSFAVPGGSDYALYSVSMVLKEAVYGGNPVSNLHIWVAADNGGEPDATPLETLAVNPVLTDAAALHTYTSLAQPRLTAGATYWIVVEPFILNTTNTGHDVGYGWHLTATPGVTGLCYRQFDWSAGTWSNWVYRGNQPQTTLRIEASPIPELSTAAFILLGVLALAVPRLVARKPE